MMHNNSITITIKMCKQERDVWKEMLKNRIPEAAAEEDICGQALQVGVW